MTINPVNMSVLPTEQCLIEDGADDFFVAGQFTPASSSVDSYQLCDPDDKCLVAGVGVVAPTTLAALERAAQKFLSNGNYADAALSYEQLGNKYREKYTTAYESGGKDLVRKANKALAAYENAARLYEKIENFDGLIRVRLAEIEVALKARPELVFDLVKKAIEARFSAARKIISRETSFEHYKQAGELLRSQIVLLHAYYSSEGADPEKIRSLYEIELDFLELRFKAVNGCILNGPPTFGEGKEAGLIVYNGAKAELPAIYARMGDIYTALDQDYLAKVAFFKEFRLLQGNTPFKQEFRQEWVEASLVVAKLARDGRSDERVERAVEEMASVRTFRARAMERFRAR